MFFENDSLYVHDSRRTIQRHDSYGSTSKRHCSKTSARENRKDALREHPLLPQEITDRIISFLHGFGFKVILLAKVGKLTCSSKSIADMTANCCVYYSDGNSLKKGLVIYRRGKISFLDSAVCNHAAWMDNFVLSYKSIAETMQSHVLAGVISPLIVPGLFLRNSNAKCC